MLLVIILSFILFLISLSFALICNMFAINPYVLFIIPCIFMTIVTFVLEKILCKKKNIDRYNYNMIVIQIPAIFGVVIALILWLFIKNEIVIRTFYYVSKYIYIPVLLFRLIYELIKNRDKNILISSGFVIGIIIGILLIM